MTPQNADLTIKDVSSAGFVQNMWRFGIANTPWSYPVVYNVLSPRLGAGGLGSGPKGTVTSPIHPKGRLGATRLPDADSKIVQGDDHRWHVSTSERFVQPSQELGVVGHLVPLLLEA
jgi:hypothetical protein